jgi:hypothetical protein
MFLDGMTGSLHSPPYLGGYMDQPVKTMSAVDIIKGVFGEKIKADAEANTALGAVKRG